MGFSIYILIHILPKPHAGVTALHTAGEEATRHSPQPSLLSERPVAWLHPSFRPHHNCSGRPQGSRWGRSMSAKSPLLPALTQGEGDLVAHAQQLPKVHLLLRGMDPKLHHPASQALALGKSGDSRVHRGSMSHQRSRHHLQVQEHGTDHIPDGCWDTRTCGICF